jgi:four helix bundle protein
MSKTHKDLDVWKKAIQLVTEIYNITESFPDKEKFGITLQIRRSSISIASNIAEGAARNTKKEFVQFLYIALGSLSELETQLIISINLGYLNSIDDTFTEIIEIRKMTLGLIKYLKSNNTNKLT